MTWMAWTAPTAAFFITLGLALCAMILLELRWPTIKQRGFFAVGDYTG